jgi:hypothetical protein
MKTKNLFLAIIFFLVSAFSINAQEKDSIKVIVKEITIKKDTVSNSLAKNKLAFQYELGYNFTGHSPIPIILSLKYHLSDKSALRFSFGLNGGMHRKYDKGHYYDTLRYNEHYDDFSHGIEKYNLSLNYLFYPKPKADVNLFFGIGPRFGFGENHMDFRNTSTQIDSLENEFENKSWSIGLSGLVGAEWFVNKSISLFTEYNATFSYQKKDYWDADYNKTTATYTFTENKTNIFRFTDVSARLGFSIYFDRPF